MTKLTSMNSYWLSVVGCLALICVCAQPVAAETRIDIKSSGNATTNIHIKANDTEVSYSNTPDSQPTVYIKNPSDSKISINSCSYSKTTNYRVTQIINSTKKLRTNIKNTESFLSTISTENKCTTAHNQLNQIDAIIKNLNSSTSRLLVKLNQCSIDVYDALQYQVEIKSHLSELRNQSKFATKSFVSFCPQ